VSITDLLFYADAVLILGSTVLAVSLRHVLHAALALMMALFSTAGLFLLLHAEFAALVQVMVYIGGVVIFIVYTILLTAHLGEEVPRSHPAKQLGALIGALLFCALLLAVLWTGRAWEAPAVHAADAALAQAGGVKTIGRRLLSAAPDGFLVPFEIVSLLLLAALVGAISIARKPAGDRGEGEK